MNSRAPATFRCTGTACSLRGA
ncbi:hypothetical protein FF041_07085 [Streptomyces jumonjinensis]|uniref:Uncharacterized protein n=1 Tax=Streptomyces jumonjinensis TaxID=1945 RepID=A0A646KCE7_STRJU|nr:hypothetical protein [Streptomyces jumonjinensis]